MANRAENQVQRLSQCLIEEIQSRTVEELARYAAKVRGDLLEEPVGRPRSAETMLERAFSGRFCGFFMVFKGVRAVSRRF